MSATAARPVREPVIRAAPMPSDVNHNGDIFGGWVMSQMDIAGGVVAAAIAQRTREIGVRTALGATAIDVVRLVAGQIATSLTMGVVLGLAAALATAKAVASQFYGVSPTDPWSFLAVPVLLVAVAVAACAVPLARALRIDPLTALRSQ